MAEAQIPCTYTLKDTKKESNWSYEDGALHVKNRLAILRDENGSKIGESLVLTAAQKQALEALGWCGGDRTCDDELKLKFPGTVTCCVQERDEPMPPPPPRARRKAAPLAPKPAKRFKQFRRPAAPVAQAPVQAEAEDDEPSEEKKPFAFLAGRNYGVRPRDAPPPRGRAAGPRRRRRAGPDVARRRARDGGFDDPGSGPTRTRPDEAPPPAAPRYDGGGYGAPPRADAGARAPARRRRPRRPSPTTPSRRPSSTRCSTARRTSRPRRGTRRARARGAARAARAAAAAAPAPPKPAPPVPPRRKPMPPLPRAPVPKPPRRAPHHHHRRTTTTTPSGRPRPRGVAGRGAAGATAPVAFEDASVTRERQRREPRGPPLTGEERRQRAADAADATRRRPRADARRAHPTAAAARSTAGALRAASAAAAARAPVIRRLGESSDDDDDLLGGPRTARKAPRPPGAALDELEARTTATPMRRTDARAAADIADSWLAAQESSIQNDGARPKKTPSSTLPQSRDDELRAPEDDVRSFVATRLSRAKTPKTPRTRKEALVDLLVEPDLHTYRQARALVGSGLEAAFYHAARGALAAANDDATLDKNVVRRAGQVLAAARDGTLVDELRRGERDDQGHVFT